MKDKELKILWILLYRQINYTCSACHAGTEKWGHFEEQVRIESSLLQSRALILMASSKDQAGVHVKRSHIKLESRNLEYQREKKSRFWRSHMPLLCWTISIRNGWWLMNRILLALRRWPSSQMPKAWRPPWLKGYKQETQYANETANSLTSSTKRQVSRNGCNDMWMTNWTLD